MNYYTKHLVLMYLIANQGRKTWTAKTLAKRLDLTSNTVAYVMRDLIEEKLVVKIERGKMCQYILAQNVIEEEQ
jgi:predicted transcriptional regulator